METASSRNLLLENIEYRVEEAPRGLWRKYSDENGTLFKEFTSHAEVTGMPVIHSTFGICPIALWKACHRERLVFATPGSHLRG